jgi:hypothetical protein
MKTSVIAIMACSVFIGTVLADEHPSEHPKAKPASAESGALDGKVFAGELGKSGEAKGDKDALTFKNGTFISSACVAYGFHEAPYTATEKDGVITFTSTPKNAKGETMSWTGTITQGVLEATAVNKTPSGETTYVFKGMQEKAKKSEHPEHPK